MERFLSPNRRRAAGHRHRRGVGPPARGLPRDPRPLRRRAGRHRRDAGDLPGPARGAGRRRGAGHGPGGDRPARQVLPAHPGPGRPRRAGRTAGAARHRRAGVRGPVRRPAVGPGRGAGRAAARRRHAPVRGAALRRAAAGAAPRSCRPAARGCRWRSSTRRTSRCSGCSSSTCSGCGCSRRWRTRSARSSGSPANGSTSTAVPDGDPATYELIRSAETLGCFQIESPGQRDLVGRLQPGDLPRPGGRHIALPARPGRRRHGAAVHRGPARARAVPTTRTRTWRRC